MLHTLSLCVGVGLTGSAALASLIVSVILWRAAIRAATAGEPEERTGAMCAIAIVSLAMAGVLSLAIALATRA